MRTLPEIPEGLLSRIRRETTGTTLSRGPIAWGIIVFVTVLFLVPYIFSTTITKALGAFGSLPTLSIADAVLSMVPVAIAVLLRARTAHDLRNES
jgi:hypothetical protein